MKLDYDLTILETQCSPTLRVGSVERGGRAGARRRRVDRHIDLTAGAVARSSPSAPSTGSISARPRRSAYATASIEVLFALAARSEELCGADPRAPPDADRWHREWDGELRPMAAGRGHDARWTGATTSGPWRPRLLTPAALH